MRHNAKARYKMREHFALAVRKVRQVMSEVAILPAKAIIRYMEIKVMNACQGPIRKSARIFWAFTSPQLKIILQSPET